MHNRLSPFLATLKERSLLSKEGSSKEVYHLVLDIRGAALPFKAGDTVGIYPENLEEDVLETLFLLKKDPATPIFHKRSSRTFLLYDFLKHHANLHYEMSTLSFDLQTFCDHLRPLLPRFYSIASSQALYPDEIHLLVSHFYHPLQEKMKPGITSHFLCKTAKCRATPIPLYIQETKTFTLPENPESPILMIGPGTGVAPFRAFMQERSAEKGKNWLFFGERNRNTDFYYENLWSDLACKNILRLNTAFSRDQADKYYVQHELAKYQKELWHYIHEEKAFVYVCGDKERMAKDVTEFFSQLISPYFDPKMYIKQLRTEKRWNFDVY